MPSPEFNSSNTHSGPFNPLGQHLLVDFGQCKQLPDETGHLQQLMETAADLTGATRVQSVFHRFAPHGLSGVVVIAESHFAVHTWPEYNAACVDIFSCGTSLDPLPAIQYLQNAFQAGQVESRTIARGETVIAMRSRHSSDAEG